MGSIMQLAGERQQLGCGELPILCVCCQEKNHPLQLPQGGRQLTGKAEITPGESGGESECRGRLLRGYGCFWKQVQ